MAEATMETVCTACRHRDICRYVSQAAEMTTGAGEITAMYDQFAPLTISVTCSRRDSSGPYASMFYRAGSEA